VSSDRGTAAVIFMMAARRAVRSGALWGAVFGAYVFSAVAQYAAIGKTAADRTRLAGTTGTNIALEALLGDARRIDTVAGYIEWRSVGVLSMLGAVWALLVATRLTRGEEDAGRWELLLAGGTTRGRALSLVMAGLAAGLVALWAVAAAACVAAGHSSHAGFTVTASLFLATTLAGAVAMFLAVGLVCGQLAGTRREANQLAGAVLGITFVIRMIADSVNSLAWLRWLSPFGWLEQAHPLTGSSPLALLPAAAFTAALCVAAAWIAGRRDVGAGLLPSRDSSQVHAALLNSPLGLALRLNRTVIAAWVAALAATAFIFGVVAKSASRATGNSTAVRHALDRLGATGNTNGTVTYLAIFFVICAALIAFAAVGQLAAARDEEAAGRVDNLLARPIGRGRWLAGRVVVAIAMIAAASIVTGLAAWAGAATQHSGVGPGALAQAGVNLAFPALFILSAGVLLYGLLPRVAPVAAYAVVTWSFILELVGAGVPLNHWLLDTSILSHIAPAPATSPSWTAAAWLCGLSLACLGVGVAAFTRRDLASA
jgi:ABC-2 type transport system permease protein